tara:strand:+ start:371 stop:715 length:345 start_codon:yes stop_codon:yes gene_type:complete
MTEIENLEEHRKIAQETVAKRDEVLKLYENDVFKRVVIEGFCRDEAVRCANAAGNPGIEERDEKQLLQMSMAGGHLVRYLRTIIQQGDASEGSIKEIDEHLDAMRADNADEIEA